MKQPESARQTRNILLVDDHFLVREGLAKLIARQGDLQVCGEAESADQALDLAARHKPDLAIVDLALKGRDGLELIKDLQAQFPDVLILVLSMYDEKLSAERTIRSGARGYVSKQEGPEAVISAIRQVLDGQIRLSPSMQSQMMLRMVGRVEQDSPGAVDQLSDGELEVFKLIAQGLSIQDIAARIGASRRAVQARCSRIKEKLRVESSNQLVQQAVLWAKEQSLL